MPGYQAMVDVTTALDQAVTEGKDRPTKDPQELWGRVEAKLRERADDPLRAPEHKPLMEQAIAHLRDPWGKAYP